MGTEDDPGSARDSDGESGGDPGSARDGDGESGGDPGSARDGDGESGGDPDPGPTDDYGLGEGPDPAVYAAETPEVHDPDDPVVAVGIGPGNAAHLTPRGRRAIADADVVVGFGTVVDYVEDLVAGELLRCGYRDEAETLERFGDRVADGAAGTAVLMGDPNHSGYQFLGKVEKAVERPVQVVPGISSLQVAASRARTPMEETTFVTLHKSGALDDDLDRLAEDVGQRHLLVLPRPYDWMPGEVAAHLLETGAAGDLEALVFEHLTHEEESVTATTLAALAEHAGGDGEEGTPFSDLSVLAIRRD